MEGTAELGFPTWPTSSALVALLCISTPRHLISEFNSRTSRDILSLHCAAPLLAFLFITSYHGESWDYGP